MLVSAIIAIIIVTLAAIATPLLLLLAIAITICYYSFAIITALLAATYIRYYCHITLLLLFSYFHYAINDHPFICHYCYYMLAWLFIHIVVTSK